MTLPAVTAVDLSHYNKHVGDVSFIAAQDDFEVTGGCDSKRVRLSIPPRPRSRPRPSVAVRFEDEDEDETNPHPTLITPVTGVMAAMFDAASGGCKYVATTDASAKPGVTVTATAQDRPGNTGMLTATK